MNEDAIRRVNDINAGKKKPSKGERDAMLLIEKIAAKAKETSDEQ